MSLDYANVHLGGIFDPGQAYVAISRCRTAGGMRITGLDPSRFKTDPNVVQYYNTLSEEELGYVELVDVNPLTFLENPESDLYRDLLEVFGAPDGLL